MLCNQKSPQEQHKQYGLFSEKQQNEAKKEVKLITPKNKIK